jgi:hypothetical protein
VNPTTSAASGIWMRDFLVRLELLFFPVFVRERRRFAMRSTMPNPSTFVAVRVLVHEKLGARLFVGHALCDRRLYARSHRFV